MLVSIIVPSYNQGCYLEATIRSILEQDHRDMEVIVNDGGSTDNSVDILQRYGDRITWKSARDHGQTDAINQGLRVARGEIAAYLNSDDVYLPGAISTVVRHFEKHPESSIIYGRALHLRADGSPLEDYPTEPWNYDRLLQTCYLCQPAVFWRRSLHEEFGYFDERLHYSMDYEYWLRVGARRDFCYLADCAPLAGSRLHEDTKTLKLRLPAHREIFQTVRRYARRPQECYGWLQHLASIAAVQRGFPPSPDPKVHARHALEFVRTILVEAEKAQVDVDDPLLTEIENVYWSMAPFV